MKRLKKAWTYLCIVAIAMICALNYNLFIFPNKFAPAGINGICTMIQYLTGINVGYMSLLINIPLAIWVYLKVSKPLAVRSMVYVAVFSVSLVVLEHVDLSAFAYSTANGTSTILGPLVGGIIYGFSYSLLVKASANSGGTDFVAAAIHKNRPDLNFFYILFALNAFVAITSYFVYDYKIEPVLLCIMYCFTSSTITDKLAKSGRSAVCFEIITDYPEEISNEIIEKLHHSCTLIPAKGMYSGRQTNMLVCVVNKTQVAALTQIVKKYPNTFAVMDLVSEVMGNFKRLDSQGHQQPELLDQGDTV
jgi:uncharacterized membrane-anchored protein YitT (DUF2179 family)